VERHVDVRLSRCKNIGKPADYNSRRKWQRAADKYLSFVPMKEEKPQNPFLLKLKQIFY